jgi:hypothetical protein
MISILQCDQYVFTKSISTTYCKLLLRFYHCGGEPTISCFVLLQIGDELRTGEELYRERFWEDIAAACFVLIEIALVFCAPGFARRSVSLVSLMCARILTSVTKCVIRRLSTNLEDRIRRLRQYFEQVDHLEYLWIRA